MLLQTWGIIRSRARKNPVLARNPPGTKEMDPPTRVTVGFVGMLFVEMLFVEIMSCRSES